MGLQTYIDDAILDLEDVLQDRTLDDLHDIEDQVWEIADTCTPIYYSDILDCASDDIAIAVTVPDCYLARDDLNPMKIMQTNIFERIQEALYERLEEWKEHQEELEDEWASKRGSGE